MAVPTRVMSLSGTVSTRVVAVVMPDTSKRMSLVASVLPLMMVWPSATGRIEDAATTDQVRSPLKNTVLSAVPVPKRTVAMVPIAMAAAFNVPPPARL